MLQFRRAGMAVAEHLATLRVDPGHHVLDGPVFSSRIHRLENQQDGVGVGCVEKLLQRAEVRDVLVQKLLIMLLRLVHRIDDRRPFPEVDRVSSPHPEILCTDFHLHPFGGADRVARTTVDACYGIRNAIIPRLSHVWQATDLVFGRRWDQDSQFLKSGVSTPYPRLRLLSVGA